MNCDRCLHESLVPKEQEATPKPVTAVPVVDESLEEFACVQCGGSGILTRCVGDIYDLVNGYEDYDCPLCYATGKLYRRHPANPSQVEKGENA